MNPSPLPFSDCYLLSLWPKLTCGWLKESQDLAELNQRDLWVPFLNYPLPASSSIITFYQAHVYLFSIRLKRKLLCFTNLPKRTVLSGPCMDVVSICWSTSPPGGQTIQGVLVVPVFSVSRRLLLSRFQSCPTLCDPRDGSPPGSPVPGILQARVLEWVAIAFSVFLSYLLVNYFLGFQRYLL